MASVIPEVVTRPVANPFSLTVSMIVFTGVFPSAAMLMARAVIFRPVAICPAAAADSVTMASAVSLTR